MRILIVADGRSPITQRWLSMLHSLPGEVGLISTYPCQPPADLDYFTVIPVAFSRLASSRGKSGGPAENPSARKADGSRRLVSSFRSLFLAGRYTLGPISITAVASRYRHCLDEFNPDLVHALRIPFEGMLAAHTPPEIPLLVSIWGNDLTLHANGSAAMRRLTRTCLARTNGLLADARRDLRLAVSWGLDPEVPVLAVPGSGGLDLAELSSCSGSIADLLPRPLEPNAQIIINPRGFRPGSVRNDTFFAAAPGLLSQASNAVLVCPSMAGQPQAENWYSTMRSMGYGERVFLLPTLPQKRLWDLFHRTQVFVSPSVHDGTPNSLLESMACGVFPIAGDIESLREWITPGVNGLLIDPGSPGELASAILLALSREDLRQKAAEYNAQLVRKRASLETTRELVAEFYQSAVKNRPSTDGPDI